MVVEFYYVFCLLICVAITIKLHYKFYVSDDATYHCRYSIVPLLSSGTTMVIYMMIMCYWSTSMLCKLQ